MGRSRKDKNIKLSLNIYLYIYACHLLIIIMELAHPPSITITSSISSLSSEPRYPWPKLKPTTRSRRRCPAGIIRLAAAATCWPHPPLIGHNVWGAQRRNRISSSTRRNNGLLVVPSATDSSVAGPEPGVGEGDERPNPMPCVFKFMSFLYPFQGKKVRLILFSQTKHIIYIELDRTDPPQITHDQDQPHFFFF